MPLAPLLPAELTFIVFAAPAEATAEVASGDGAAASLGSAGAAAATPSPRALPLPLPPAGRMVGDCNLFLLDERQAEDYLVAAGEPFPAPAPPAAAAAGSAAAATGAAIAGAASRAAASAEGVPVTRAAEIMVMIAEPSARRKGFAAEAAKAIMTYGEERTASRIARAAALLLALLLCSLVLVPVRVASPVLAVHRHGTPRHHVLRCQDQHEQRRVHPPVYRQAGLCGSQAVRRLR